MREVASSDALADLKKGPLTYQGRRIVADFYKPIPFFLRAIEVEGGVRIEGRAGDLALHECDLASEGPPHWILFGIRLKLLEGDVEWEWIERARQRQVVSASEWRILRDRLDRDGDLAPPYDWIPLEKEMVPIAKLQDGRGLFVDLDFDYGGSLHRDGESEKRAATDLIEAGYQRRERSYYCPADRVGEALLLLLECGWRCETAQGDALYLPGALNAKIESQKGCFLAEGELDGRSLGDLAKAVQGGHPLLPTNKGVALLSGEWIRGELGALLHGERVADKVAVHRAQLPELKEILSTDLRGQIEALRSSPVAPVGSGFTAQLRPYQQKGVDWLDALSRFELGGILADEMGLGKTVQIIGWLSRMEKKGCALIVVPTSLLSNWRRELARFLPSVEVALHHGIERGELPLSGVILTSYATLRLDQEQFLGRRFDLIALDEAQAIKNPDAQTARALFELDGRLRIAITGTPIENSWDDLWSLMRFAQPDLLGPRGASPRPLGPFLLRREKREVAADLPQKIEQEVWIEWEGREKELYDQLYSAVRNRALERVTSSGEVSKVEILEGLLRLRQLCCHPLLIEAHLADDTHQRSSKFERLLADLEQVEGKVLVYSQFTSMLDLIQRDLPPSTLRLDGSTKNRQAVVDQFQEDESVKVLLLSLKAGGVGLNLTAAETVFLYEPWWTDAAEAQAIDRVHRIGQERSVMVRRYLVAGTIEERMMELKAMKRGALDELFEESPEEFLLNLQSG